MELIYLNNKLNTSIEHEIFSDNEHGFFVDVIYIDNKKQTFNNVTEVHYLYDSILDESVAFESDIHSTGCTRSINNIKQITINLSNKKEIKF